MCSKKSTTYGPISLREVNQLKKRKKKEQKGNPELRASNALTNEEKKTNFRIELIDSSHLTLSRERERERACFSLLPFLLPRRSKERERERDGRVALGFEKREREGVIRNLITGASARAKKNGSRTSDEDDGIDDATKKEIVLFGESEKERAFSARDAGSDRAGDVCVRWDFGKGKRGESHLRPNRERCG